MYGTKTCRICRITEKQGITKESWFLQKTSKGDMVIVHFEADDLEKTFEALKAVPRLKYETSFG